jgi:hypothetical protein
MPHHDVDEVQEVLNAFEEVVRQERDALTQLDVSAIDSCADRKLQLAESLQAMRGALANNHADQVGRVLRQLRLNQVLLVHARDHAQGALALMGVGDTGGKYSSARPADRLRLDVRG